jgi:5-methylcytosine-specific restriction endonuclease McrA
MGRKTPPCPKYPKWTEARYRTFIRSALRSASIRWPPAQEAKKLARRPSQRADKRIKWEYNCACCGDWFLDKECHLDHIVEAGNMMEGMDHSSIGDWVDRLYCKISNYQMLCKACHMIKTHGGGDE